MSIETAVTEIRGKLVTTGESVLIELEGGRIAKISPSSHQEPDNDELWIAPGLIDLQINGYAGYDVNLSDSSMEERIETIRLMVDKVLASGVTSFCPTIITAGYEQINDTLTALRLACERYTVVDETIVGIHMEGPYLSDQDGPRGAHPKEHIRDPEWTEFTNWQHASGGRIRVVTIAPERSGALAMIRELAREGILVCIGHTAATHEEIAAAVDAGARMSTHLGNAAHLQLPRHPNYIWSQLSEDRLSASIIADGHHLHPSVVKVIARVKHDRLVLVSDAVHLAGMKAGIYKTHVGGEVELLPSGRLQMAANPLMLAGAAVSLSECVQCFMRFTGAELSEAVRMATLKPAQLLGEQQIGAIEAGYWADLILLAWDKREGSISIRSVIKRGKQVHNIQ
ncbi:N-acetylglucosamine-6-phosphate deacetylase [Paenibacillus radicis (ex Xue et al. 2023)]|uniref:N-acetylglucosamine-6-phosphate deacetylase n=1 Tax=Paenibacillus radicis (ex Xue et al. 2023) TaxID=2972489 RepID=A0ABT1YGD5_9BACL|nr:N-acetylglucosamine-6-phosphate deacetylase [Paenibacillus radicis (ex Xue et al. 2023)]MCR8632246.1 N-acetylglucosamine-6-phosphate deacetylase [Paenibacillus radicis (ex Xue et al. 2023)]